MRVLCACVFGCAGVCVWCRGGGTCVSRLYSASVAEFCMSITASTPPQLPGVCVEASLRQSSVPLKVDDFFM